MLVSPEFIGLLIAMIGMTITFAVAVFSTMAWAVRRMDKGQAETRSEVGELRNDIVELKMSVARLEGPRQHLIVPD